MRRNIFWTLLFGLCHFVTLDLSAVAADKLEISLEAEGAAEIAPHGTGNIYAPEVMLDGHVWRLWYGGQGKDGHDRISYAVSTDGKSWERKGVVVKDDNANHVNDPSLVKVNGTFYLYYTRTEKDVVDRIDVAVSDDGQSWTPRGVVIPPGPDGAWDGLSVGRPAVIFEDGKFKLWYDGRKDFPPGAPVKGVPISAASHRSVGYATSNDGLTWVKHGSNPVFGNDAGAVDVKRKGDALIMLYESHDGTRFAASKDGIAWQDGGIFIKKSGKPIDAFGHVTPFLYLDPGKASHRLFVGAASATTWDHNCIAMFELSDARLNHILRGNDKRRPAKP